MLSLTAVLIYTVTTMTTVFLSTLQWNNSLFLPSPPLEVAPLNPARESGGVLSVLAWWQQFPLFSGEPIGQISRMQKYMSPDFSYFP